MQKLSFTTLSTPGYGIADVARLARRFGYDGVDLRLSGRAGDLLPDASPDVIKAARNILASEGVEAAGLLCYLTYEATSGTSLPVSLRGQMLRQLEIAKGLGARSVRIGGGRSGGRCFTDELCQALADVLGQAAGIDIVIQNHSDAFTAAECLGLVKALDHPGFSLAFSPDHCLIMGEDFHSIFRELPGRVRKLFVSDMKISGGSHQTVLPGMGAVPIQESYEAVGGTDFDGWITFKYEQFWEPALLGPEESLPHFIQKSPNWFPGWKGSDRA